jgi:tetratricopeptide (TPR) repeat protein
MAKDETESANTSLLSEIGSIAGGQGKVKAYMKKAEEYEKGNNYAGASEAYNEALAEGPNKKTKFEIYLRLGECELKRKQYSSAIEYLKTASDLYPKDNDTHIKLARAYEESDLKGFAENEYLNVLKRRKKSFDASFGLAMLYFDEGFYTKAMDNFNRALALNASQDVYRKSASCARKLNDIDLAVSMLKQVIALGPVYEDHINMGELYEIKKQPDDAERSYNLAIKLDPDKKDSYLRLGALYLGLERFADAENVLRSSYSKKPVCGLDHFFLGVLYQKTGRVELAKAELKQAEKQLGSGIIKNYISFISK